MQSNERTIGIDIGGTKTALALVDENGRICQRLAFPTDAQRGFRDALDRITDAIARLLTEASDTTPSLVGIGMCDDERQLMPAACLNSRCLLGR